MNIVQLLSQVELTGAEVHAVHLAEALQKQGHGSYLISDELHMKTQVPFISLPIHRAKGSFQRWASIRALRKFILENNIQIVHAHSRGAVRIGYWACRKTPAALVTTLHGRQHYSFSKKLFNLYGDKVIAVCENIKEQMKKDFSFIDSQIQVIRNFFDVEGILKSQTADTKPVTSKNFVLSCLGRTTGPKGKNWEFFIQNQAANLLAKHPSLEIHFGGGPFELLSIQAQKTFSQLQNQYPQRVIFHGQNESLFPIIKASNLVLAAGRIAIESLLLKKHTLALGEQSYEGLVTKETFFQTLSSNFGDILSGEDTNISWAQIITDIEKEIQNPSPIDFEKITNYLLKTFDEKPTVEKIKAVYASAIFKKKYPKNIPILMYHQIVDEGFTSPHKIYITESNFEKHLQFFKQAGFTSLTFKDLYEFKMGIKDFSTFPDKPLILTFDDGYVNNLTKAAPLLKKYGFKAVIYLLATPHETNYWDKDSGAPQLPLMNTQQRQEISQFMEIGSHGFDHKKLTEMNLEEARHEIAESKNVLEKEFQQTIYSYAYTYGIRHDFSSALAYNAGYKYAVNTTSGGFHHEDDPFSLFRVSIFPTDDATSLKRKTKSWYRKYYYLKRKE